MFKIVPLFL